MFYTKNRLKQWTLILSMLFFTLSCGILGSDSSENGNIEVKMHDAPALYQEVNVKIEKVEVRSSGGSWTTISSGPTKVDVTTLINGNFATLAEADVEAGSYNQMRLIFGADNSLKMAGTDYELQLSSEVQEGIVLNINLNADAESNATFLLDFNLRKSIVESALDIETQFMLSPVIEVRRAKQTGNIAGSIRPATAKPWVYALHDSDTVSSTLADTSSGDFELTGLKENTYDVYIEPTESLYNDTTISGVQVEARQTNDVGQIELSMQDTTKQEPIQ